MSDLQSSARRYLFSVYGQPERFRRWRNLQARQQARQVYQALPNQEPFFDKIISMDYLLRIAEQLRAERGQAPGSEGLTCDDSGRSEIAAVLRTDFREIAERAYRPYGTRRVTH